MSTESENVHANIEESRTERRLSLIMPCYNAAAYLPEALQSLLPLQEAHPGLFRVICVDDGSEDDTLHILQQYKSSLPLTILRTEHAGVSHARNRAMEETDTEYLAFLDADDVLSPVYLDALLPLFPKKPDTVVWPISRSVEKVRRERPADINAVSVGQESVMSDFLYHMPSYGFSCLLYRREILLRNGLRFDEQTTLLEDREFAWKYLCHCSSFYRINAALYGYRTNPESVTKTSQIRWDDSPLRACVRIEAYLRESGNSFVDQVRKALYPQVVWTLARRAARAGRRDLFDRLAREYDVRECMRLLQQQSSRLPIRLSAGLYLINPMLFYLAARRS